MGNLLTLHLRGDLDYACEMVLLLVEFGFSSFVPEHPFETYSTTTTIPTYFLQFNPNLRPEP